MASAGEVPFKVEHVMTGIPQLKCLECIAQAQQAVKDGDPVEPIRDAVTLAPTWVSKQIGMQMVFASVAVPSCMEHLTMTEKSPQERAMEGGIVLGGDGVGFGGGG